MRTTLVRLHPTLGHVVSLIALLCCLISIAEGEVRSVALDEMLHDSELIVIGRVVDVCEVDGIRLAEIECRDTLKGDSRARVYYLAEPRWACDTSDGEVGNVGLFLLKQYASESSDRKARDVATINFPKDIVASVKRATAAPSWYVLVHSGRGYLPIVEDDADGDSYVGVWERDIRLPEGTRVFSDGPLTSYSELVDWVQLGELMSIMARAKP